MPTYNVSVQNSNYNVLSEPQKNYAIGVTYDIPAKYLQNNNIVLDDVTTQFNGTTNTFNLTNNNIAYTPTDSSQIIVSINGAIQHPGIDYSVSGDQIILAQPPSIGDKMFIIALATTADLTRTINFVHSSGSFDMSSGEKGEVTLDVTGVIESWVVTSDVAGTLILNVEKCTLNDYPNFQSICGTDKPTILNNVKGSNDNLTAWTKEIIAGDIIRVSVDQVSNIRRFMLGMKLLL
jgi:hypothetical protein